MLIVAQARYSTKSLHWQLPSVVLCNRIASEKTAVLQTCDDQRNPRSAKIMLERLDSQIGRAAAHNLSFGRYFAKISRACLEHSAAHTSTIA